MIVLFLAAGYGTRMYPLTENKPKALLPIKNKAILSYLLEKCEPLKPEKVVLVSNDKYAAPFQKWFEAGAPAGSWQVLNDGSTSEADRLGSVGDLGFAIERAEIDDDLLIIGSDNLFEEDLSGFATFADTKKQITLGAYELPDKSLASQYGVLSVDSDWKIESFLEKPKEPPSTLVSTAVYFFPRAQLRLVLKYVSSSKSADTLGNFISWLIARESVYAYPFKGRWFDIGDLKSYKEAQQSWHSS